MQHIEKKTGFFPRFASVIIILVVWEFSVVLLSVPEIFAPRASTVAQKIYDWAQTAEFWLDVSFSVGRVFTAFCLSAALALPIALLSNQSATFKPVIETLTDIFRYIPVPALVPLTVLLFGVGEFSKVALLFLGTFFQLLLLFSDDLQAIPKNYNDLFYCLRLNNFQRIKRVILASAPRLFDSCRITVGWCWTYVIIAELVAAKYGIGHAIKEFQRFSDSPGVYSGIVVMAAIGFATDLGFRRLSRSLFTRRYAK